MTSQVKLPEPDFKTMVLTDEGESGYFTADQMRQFREEGVREVLHLAKQMFKSGLEHAAVYVEDHCQDGEFHAEQISNFPLPIIQSTNSTLPNPD